MRNISTYGWSLAAWLFLLPQLCAAQAPRMDSVMTKNGKIYVVVAVLAVIMIGIILYLTRMDRRISKLEKE